ncbi:hypothetical protein BDQ17DRAFT_1416602 [Cyathus striatus]|nr:hypothetical protein BDQ17DRAFT_1416602 [Cyathus striatus]
MDMSFNMSPGVCPPAWYCDYINAVMSKFPNPDLPMSSVRSNYSLTPQDRSLIENQLSYEDAIDTLDEEVHALRIAISTLETRQSLYRKYKEYQFSFLSPIRKMPNELLVHIFTYVCADSIDLVGTVPGDFWDIQRVCVHWRNIIHSTPSLWRSFEIKEISSADPNTPPPAMIAYRIQLCLQYSGNSPLAISLRPVDVTAFPIFIMEDIANQCHRWERFAVDVDILVGAREETDIRVIIKNKGLPNLRELTIDGQEPFGSLSGRTPCPFRLFKGASAVEEIYLFSTTLPGVKDFPWSSTRKLVLEQCDILSDNELGSVLRVMPSLEELVWYSNNIRIDSEESPAINIPSLRTLTVESPDLLDDIYSDDDPPIFPKLFIPHLTNLKIVEDIREIHSSYLVFIAQEVI